MGIEMGILGRGENTYSRRLRKAKTGGASGVGAVEEKHCARRTHRLSLRCPGTEAVGGPAG